MTVKVNEALCEMKEKLEKTERRVREVMKEKEQLEKILEAKLKMIKVVVVRISDILCSRARARVHCVMMNLCTVQPHSSSLVQNTTSFRT